MSSPVAPLIRHRTRSRPVPSAAAPAAREPAHPGDPQPGDPFAPVPSEATRSSPYTVGYKRPPVHTRFQKGRSGNPKGRPRGAKNLTTIVSEVLNTRRTVRVDGRERQLSGLEIVMQQQIKKAMAGDLKATQFVISLLPNNADTDASATPSTAPPDPGLDASDHAMLRHHYNAVLTARGLDAQQVEDVLQAFGVSSRNAGR